MLKPIFNPVPDFNVSMSADHVECERHNVRPSRTVDKTRIAAAIDSKLRDKDGDPIPEKQQRAPQARKAVPKCKRNDACDEESDPDDGDFAVSGEGSEDSTSDDEPVIISNIEVADMLPSKTIPEASGHKSCTKAKGKQAASRPSKKKARRAPVKIEEVKDEDSTRNIAARKAPVTEAAVGHQDKCKTGKGVKKNPIYWFFKVVSSNAEGSVGNPGDKHYWCYHSSHKIIMITKGMNSNLNREY
ncbi:uncharacterized protein LACBIDRAFT_309763 [Laccaria bicolor S238N-H82]|uniref:Predicted protein n=1 Tax=Laccaria bicolor (strain S238N-H82 / ATCC MYA-4686) TaxID=486041 RepID=B0DT13_LACBS|nr:uncharacterized protein LACBIDRAFT_309763 [Laccaria bicolor S238N-H82]EDR02414.1 predicted protein [Laccaria bicolor S238N-H82]|eukprot:XP_001887091.1 predicted protein [Laccaria bicolor S238N-H82]